MADTRRDTLESIAREGGDIALDAFRDDLTVETKAGPMDAVTEVDREVQRQIFDRIRDAYPDDAVVGEEEDALKVVPETGYTWVVDPIDGTNNYVVGDRAWAVSVALVHDGDAVAAVNHLPALGDTYVATDGDTRRDETTVSVSDETEPSSFKIDPVFGLSREHRRGMSAVSRLVAERFGDLRRSGSGQTTLSRVASGELDAAVTTVTLPPWDTIAGIHLIRAAGGTVTDLDGDRWHRDSVGFVASNGRAHDALVEAFDAP